MIRLLLTPFFASVVLWTWFGLPPRSDSAEVTELLRLNSRGVAFMEQLDYKAAGNEFSRLLELDPDFVPGHVTWGWRCSINNSTRRPADPFKGPWIWIPSRSSPTT